MDRNEIKAKIVQLITKHYDDELWDLKPEFESYEQSIEALVSGLADLVEDK